MKKLMFLFVMLFCITSTFAQADIVPASEPFGFWESLKSIFIPGILTSALVLFADAKKHFNTPEWSWYIFVDSKLNPFLITIGVAIAIYALLVYVPFAEPFLNILAGSNSIALTSGALFGAAASIIDGFTKSKK